MSPKNHQSAEPPTPPISEIPSLKKLRDEVNAILLLSKVIPVVSPLLRALGLAGPDLQRVGPDVARLVPEAEHLLSFPDRFNDLFAEKGWIIYESAGHEPLVRAAEAAESGEWARAEEILIGYYDENNLDWQLQRLRSLMHADRYRLLQLAKVDYLAGRYHACVPVVLAQLDGLVNDLSPQGTGFSATNADMTAWDSITANEKGLQRLHAIIHTKRERTSAEALVMPFRHGILHGRDLGYDTKPAAARAWAAVFAVGDWARRAKNKELRPPPPVSEPGLLESLKKLARTIDTGRRQDAILAAWKPRVVVIGQTMPERPTVEQLDPDSPERSVVLFLDGWVRRRYGPMAAVTPIRPGVAEGRKIHELRVAFQKAIPHDFQLTAVRDQQPGFCQVDVRLLPAPGAEWVCTTIRLVFEDANKNWVVPGCEPGTWVLLNWEGLPNELGAAGEEEGEEAE